MPVAKEHKLRFSPNEERVAMRAGRGRSARGVHLMLIYVRETWPAFVAWAHARKEWVTTDAPLHVPGED